MKRILTLLLALVIGIGVLPPVQAHAQEECKSKSDHRFTEEWKYVRVRDDINGVESYRYCGKCNQWIMWHDAVGDPDRGHTYKVIQNVAATCTTDGYDLYKCNGCGLEVKENIVKATGHRFSDWKVVKEAACEAAGEKQRECEACHTVEKEALPALELKWSDWKVTKEASCTETGEETRSCEQCKKEEKRELPKGEHKWSDWKVTKEASCTEAGEETRSCERCKGEEKRALAAKGHGFGEWTVVKAATCKEAGQEKRTCATCKTEEQREIAKTEHQWGNWAVTKQAGHGQKGEEERVCKVCKEKETREVDGDKPLAKAGSQGLTVLITQELLAAGGEYTGATDGVMNEELADAIRVFEAANNWPETGDIYADTLHRLNERYFASFEGNLPRQGMLEAKASGLRTRLVLEDHYTSNEDGSHGNAPVVTAVQYLSGQEEMTLPLAQESRLTFPEATESCELMNESLTCGKCGYHEELTWMLTNGIGGIGGPSLYDLHEVLYLNTTEDLGLGDIQNIDYFDNLQSMCWDRVEGATTYHVVIEKDEEIVFSGYTEDCLLPRDAWHDYGEGSYYWWIQAEDGDGNPLSNNTNIRWDDDGNRMPEPMGLALEYAQASWSFPYEKYQAVFRLRVHALLPGEDGYEEQLLLDTETDAMQMDLKEIYFKNTELPYGTKLRLSVQTKDLNGKREDSEEYQVTDDYYRPDFLRVSSTVLVREGAGKSFERIGSLQAGSCVLCWDHVAGEDGSYAKISYEGVLGYVNEEFLAWFQPVEFEVEVDLDDGRKVMVPVNIDGTLNSGVFHEKVKKTGYRITGILHFRAGEPEGFDWNTVLTENSTLHVGWEMDPAYVKISFMEDGRKLWFLDHDFDIMVDYYMHKLTSDAGTPVFTKNGEDVFAYARENNSYWNTASNGTGVIVNDASEITSDMKTLFLVEYSDKDYIVGEVGTFKEIYREAIMDSSIRIGFLQKGDKIKVLDTVNTHVQKELISGNKTIKYELNFYKIYSYRLNTEGYILTAALDNAASLGGYSVQFDAAGGLCAVKLMTAKKSNDYRIRELPKPAKDGHTFLGWTDEKGELVNEDYVFTKDCTLKAKWREGYHSTKVGVIRPSEYFRTGRRDPKYYDVFLYDDEDLTAGKQRVYSGTQVSIVDEAYDAYYCVLPDGREGWMSKANVSTAFTGVSLSSNSFLADEFSGGATGIKNNAYFSGTKTYPIKYGSWVYIIGEQASDRKWTDSFSRFPVVWESDSIFIHEGAFEEGFLESHFGWAEQGLVLDDWGRTKYVSAINLDPQGGYCDKDVIWESTSSAIGSLPEPVFPGKEFLGWYTAPVGGIPVTKDTEVWRVTGATIFDEVPTIYAHWSGEDEKEYRTVDQKRGIYERPHSTTELIGHAEPGDVIIMLNGRNYRNGMIYDNGYQLVNCNGTVGYMDTSELIPVKPVKLRRIENGPKSQPIRLLPTYSKAKSLIIREIVDGEIVYVIEEKEGWAAFAFKAAPDGKLYVRMEYYAQ
ncbi:MAG: InlB B-repeat-containing protein [Lachnospiraceae bacterium]|nr:InlB B-repeat-containing protein [Lachnospiraceae bacterium]